MVERDEVWVTGSILLHLVLMALVSAQLPDLEEPELARVELLHELRVVSLASLQLEEGQLPDRVRIAPPAQTSDESEPVTRRDDRPPEPQVTPPPTNTDAQERPASRPTPVPAPPSENPNPAGDRRSREEILAALNPELRGTETRLPSSQEGSEEVDHRQLARLRAGRPMTAYQRRVHDLIRANWHPNRRLVEQQPDLFAAIRFKIDRNGTIYEVSFAQRSGDGTFDRSCMSAVRRTGRLPLPPANEAAEVADGFVVTFSPQDLT